MKKPTHENKVYRMFLKTGDYIDIVAHSIDTEESSVDFYDQNNYLIGRFQTSEFVGWSRIWPMQEEIPVKPPVPGRRKL